MSYSGSGGYDEHKLQNLPPGGTVSLSPFLLHIHIPIPIPIYIYIYISSIHQTSPANPSPVPPPSTG